MAPKGTILKIVFVSAVILLMANLSALSDHFLHSEIPWFDEEHLIVGGLSALLTAVLFFVLAIHANKLRQNEERLNSLFEASSDFICILDLRGNIIQINQAMINTSGYSKDEIIGHSMHEFVPPSYQQKCDEQFPVLLKEGHNRVEIEFVRKDGTIINMDCSATAVHDKKGEITSFMMIQRDISKRKNAEKALKESESLYRSLIEISPDAIVLLDLDANIMMINRQAMVLFERNSEGMIGKSWFGFILPDELARAKENLHSILAIGNVRNLNHTIMKKDGACFPSELSASLIRDADGKATGIIVILRDITEKMKFEQERKKLDERLFLEQKESSILTLAGGIAHDFNNLLMSVVGNAELLKMKVSLKNNEEEFLQNIIASSERMADLTRQLLAYAKGGMYQQKIVSINSLIQEALDLTHKGEALVIETRLDLSEDLWPVLADQGQMNRYL